MLTNRELIQGKDALTEDIDIIVKYIKDIRKNLGYGSIGRKSDISLSSRQVCTSENCITYIMENKYSDAWREFYDCIYNYNDCDHITSLNEYGVFNILLMLLENTVVKENK